MKPLPSAAKEMLLLALTLTCFFSAAIVQASSEVPDYDYTVIDPEEPGDIINPGESPFPGRL